MYIDTVTEKPKFPASLNTVERSKNKQTLARDKFLSGTT